MERKCCAMCQYLSPEDYCEYKFEYIPEDEMYECYCDMFKEID